MKDDVKTAQAIGPDAFINRELSWLAFASRVLAFVADPATPLLERVKFAGIMGMLHDEFFMKRIGGIKRQLKAGLVKRSLDGRTPREELEACRAELLAQIAELADPGQRRDPSGAGRRGSADPRLRRALEEGRAPRCAKLFERSILPDPDAAGGRRGAPVPVHPQPRSQPGRAGRAKAPNRALRADQGAGQPPALGAAAGRRAFVPLEQVIAANLDQLFPEERVVGV